MRKHRDHDRRAAWKKREGAGAGAELSLLSLSVTDQEDEVRLLQPRRVARLQVDVQRPDLLEVSEPDARRALREIGQDGA